MPKPREIATLIVRGINFRDWLTVWVQHRWADPAITFRFTCAEREPMPPVWTKLQFKPGDNCTIKLAGQLAVTGKIITRQIAYDAQNHQTLLIGKGFTWWGTRASVRTKDGNFDGMNVFQVATKLLTPFGIKVRPVGSPNPLPFRILQSQPGENIWNFLERIARPRGIVLGSDEEGNFLVIGDRTGFVIERLIEGVNILRCQCIISKDDIYDRVFAQGQTPATDEQYGRKASEQEAMAKSKYADRPSHHVVVAEQPVWNEAEIQQRAENERRWRDGTIIQVTVTVQGWTMTHGALWRPGMDVHIKSPMAMLDDIFAIASVTFTQDNESGTLTTLECWVPWLLLDHIPFKGFSFGDSAGEPAKSTGDGFTPNAPTPEEQLT
jgi:prophage tail gpP-like protein